jgi:hypothetical protein
MQGWWLFAPNGSKSWSFDYLSNVINITGLVDSNPRMP